MFWLVLGKLGGWRLVPPTTPRGLKVYSPGGLEKISTPAGWYQAVPPRRGRKLGGPFRPGVPPPGYQYCTPAGWQGEPTHFPPKNLSGPTNLPSQTPTPLRARAVAAGGASPPGWLGAPRGFGAFLPRWPGVPRPGPAISRAAGGSARR